MVWITMAVVLLAGLSAGYFIGRFNSDSARENRKLGDDLLQVRQELAAYRQQVSEHFSQSAELINTMTDNYRAVYRHLAEAGQRLCGDASLRPVAIGYQDTASDADQGEPRDDGGEGAAAAAGGAEGGFEEGTPERVAGAESGAEPGLKEGRVH